VAAGFFSFLYGFFLWFFHFSVFFAFFRFNPKSEQILKYKIVQILEEKK
jgi:hypothetical protein